MPPMPKKKVEKGPPGRPKHDVWSQGFRRVLKHCETTHRTVNAAYCILCSKVLCNTASKRLTAHRRVCSFESNNEEVIDTDLDIGKITKIITPENSTTITFIDMDDSLNYNEDQTGEISYSFIIDDQDLEEDPKPIPPVSADHKLDIVLSEFFIGCNIPFSIAESPYFKKLCTTLNSKFKPITSENLAGPLLDTVYSKICKDTKVGPTSILMIDGWKTQIGNPKTITVMLKTEANETIFMDNYELSINSRDSMQELTDITKSCVMEATDQFKTEVYAVILGNDFTLKLDKDDDLWQFPCNLQILSNVINDCATPNFMNILCKTLKHCNITFKASELEKKLCNETSWESIKYMLQFCNSNIDMIQTVLSSDSNEYKITKDLKNNFFDMDFIRKIEYCSNLMDLVTDLSTVCRTPKSSIADAAEQWLSLQMPCNESDILEKIIEYRNKALIIHGLVANYLHPSYRGQKLTGEQMNKVEEFLLNFLDAEGLESLQAYVNEEGIFKSLNLKENVTAKTYWGFARRTHTKLANLALKLLGIPASITSNSLEYFNTMNNNYLRPDKMRKLFAVYYHLKEKEGRIVTDTDIEQDC